MAQRDYDVEVPDFDRDSKYGFNRDWKAEREWMSDLISEGDRAYVERGDLIGYVARFNVADGYAFYKVTSLRPLKLAHVPTGDAYMIPDAHLRGLRKADIVENAEWFGRIWGRVNSI